jgi:spore germination protein (amino acid permease)
MDNMIRITAIQAYSIALLSIGLMNHVELIPVLLSIAKRDAWAGVILAVVPACAFALLLAYVARKTRDVNVVAAIRSRYGRLAALLFGGITSLYAFLSLLLTLKDTSNWARIAYLPQTPVIAIALVLTVLCVCSAMAGIRAIAICSGVLLPIVILLGLFVMSANFQFKDYSLLFPMFTHGYRPLGNAAFFSMAGITELVLLLFLQQHIKTSMRTRGLLFMAVCLIGLTVGPLAGAIAIFGPFEASELRYPAFEQWRMVVISRFITHLDALSIFQWLSGAFIRISFLMFLILDLHSRQSIRRKRIVLALMLVLLGLVFTAVPINDILLYRILQTVFPYISILFGVLMLLALAAMARFGKALSK